MKICFVSNYINHHQIPLCNALHRETGGNFIFIQTEPMEEERVQMGWQESEWPEYVHYYYKEESRCREEIQNCDVLIFGGCDDESYIQERLQFGKMIFRYMERLYKTGQWKAVSPRGLVQKYKDHTRYRKSPVYLLCAGGYVASDFQIVRAYPDKMFCWGYFPETKHYDVDQLLAQKGYEKNGRKVPYLLWAARFIDWKHPERAVETARFLKEKGIDFHLDMIGGGVLESKVKQLIEDYGLGEYVTLLGYCPPAKVRERMEKADIFLMTSDRQEGWGAVANEAMNSACAVVADHMPGAVPYLIRQSHNGCVYPTDRPEKLYAITEQLIRREEARKQIGKRAYETIVNVWNAEQAAHRLMQLIDRLVAGGEGIPVPGRKNAEEAASGMFASETAAPETPASGMSESEMLASGMSASETAAPGVPASGMLAPGMPAPIIPEKHFIPEVCLNQESNLTHKVYSTSESNLTSENNTISKGNLATEDKPTTEKGRAEQAHICNSAELPLLSIIVPVYNIMEYLPRCVHSITAQTYQNLEIILVDDGSTDGTGALCDELAGEDGRIRVIHKENGGSSSARNLAIKQARGEYLGFVDSDDFISSDMYELLYKGIMEYNVSVAQIGRDEIDMEGNLLPNICEPPGTAECIGAEDFLRELLMHRGDCSFCTKLIRRDLFAGEQFPEGLLNEDFHLLVKILPQIGKIVSLPGQTYHVFYRIGSNSRKAEKDNFSRVFGDCVDNADMVSDIVEEKYPTLKETALRFGVFQRLEYLLHIPIGQMNRENTQYRLIVKWMRKNWIKSMVNPHLTLKNKCYHTLFAIAPKGIRQLHRRLRAGKGA